VTSCVRRAELCLSFGLLILLAAASLRASPERVALLLDASSPQFSGLMLEGAQRALKESGRKPQDFLWKSAPKGEQAGCLEEWLRSGVRVLLVDAADRQAMAAPLDKARSAGTRVILLNSGFATEPQLSVVATDNREAGRLAARELARLLGGKGGVLLLRHQIHSAKAEAREEGFLELVTSEFPNLRLVASDYHAGPGEKSAERVSEALLERYRGRIDGVFASCESATLGMLAALRHAGLAGGRIKFVGSDEGNTAFGEALVAGDLQAFVSEDPVAMGYEGMKSALALLRGDQASRFVTTRLSLVNAKGTFVKSADGPASLADFQIPLAETCEPLPQGPRVGGVETVPDLGLILLPVSPGRTISGGGEKTSDSKVRRPLRRFWLGQYEVTQAQWKKLMGRNPSEFRGDSLPVDNIGWFDAMEFCRRLNEIEAAAGRLPAGYVYTLPTEAQWECASRAGRTGDLEQPDPGWWATNSGMLRPESNLWRMSTHPVGLKQANPWGFYDLGGNVSEWCLDRYSEAASKPGPSAIASGRTDGYRVLRGGCWWADPQNCLPGSRNKAPPDRHHGGLGMRLALSPAEEISVEGTPESGPNVFPNWRTNK
jgi:ribose transport system substrate-binding protein